MESFTEAEKLLLYTMSGFVGLLIIGLIITAINSYRSNKQYNSWKEAKIQRLATLKAALIARENFEGYIVLNVKEENKSLMHDVLKGFEEYALLKGYKVKLSINVEEQDKILVKITEVEPGSDQNEEGIRFDLEEYITKIRNGEIFENIPRFLDPIQHERIILALKNRIYFLQQNYEVQKNIQAMYENVINSIGKKFNAEHPSTTFYITGMDASMDKRKFIANNSSNVAQGDLQNSSAILGSTINIRKSFNEKKCQIEDLKSLIDLLKHHPSEESILAARNIENVVEELEDEENPNLGMIEKWLNKAGKVISVMEKSSKIFIKAKEIYDGFGISL